MGTKTLASLGIAVALGLGSITATAQAAAPPGTSTIGNLVWDDVNRNGVQDVGELGIAGVSVNLLDANGGLLASTTTGANGNYSFSQIAAGSYIIEVKPPEPTQCYTFTVKDVGGNDTLDSDVFVFNGRTAPIAVADGETNNTVDAGLLNSCGAGGLSLGDRVWYDLNVNGIQDPFEGGVAGVQVLLLNSVGAVVNATTTDGNGNYLFGSLPPGTYSVRFVQPAGYVFTLPNIGPNDAIDSDANPMTSATSPYALSAASDLTADAGVYRPAEIGDRVWMDANANGVQDPGEVGLPLVTVQLLDAVGNLVSTTATDANGAYLFTGVRPGTYSVKVVPPTSYLFTAQDVGSDTADSDVSPSTGTTASITLTNGESNRTVDAGVYLPSSIGDRVWLDQNANGIQDTGETGLSGVTVHLLDAAGATVASTTTNATGTYLFNDLKPGTYSITVIAPANHLFSPQNIGADDAVDSDVSSAGASGPYVLVTGRRNSTADAGLYPAPASLGGLVWIDGDTDGVRGETETVVSGVSVTLLGADGATVATTTTGPDGSYVFTGLAPGSYSVRVGLSAGYEFTVQDAGSDDAIDSDVDVTSGVTGSYVVTAGQAVTGVDAGLVVLPVAVGETVFLDSNANGVQDLGETGLPGVTITITDADGQVVGMQVTDADGLYGFILEPGIYTVTVTVPTGYQATTSTTYTATLTQPGSVDLHANFGVNLVKVPPTTTPPQVTPLTPGEPTTLPQTGAHADGLGAWALALIVAGAALAAASRRGRVTR